jgi:hypothetical protein
LFSPSVRFSLEPVLITFYEDNSFLSFLHYLYECFLYVTNESGSFLSTTVCLLQVTSLISAEKLDLTKRSCIQYVLYDEYSGIYEKYLAEE